MPVRRYRTGTASLRWAHHNAISGTGSLSHAGCHRSVTLPTSKQLAPGVGLALLGSHTHQRYFFTTSPSPSEPVEGNQLVAVFSGLLDVEAPAAKIGLPGAELVALDPIGADVRGRGGAFVEARRSVLSINSGAPAVPSRPH